MKKFTLILVGFVTLWLNLKAQNSNEKLYTMSGLGFAFPIGETADYLSPKFSSAIGLNLAVGSKGFFIYPKVSLHAFSYNEITPENGFSYTIQKGRATTYLLNLALGYRKTTGKLTYYFFAGTGGGFITIPHARVSNTSVSISHSNKGMITLETGMGLAYNIGDAVIFVEPSYMLGFQKIQNRTFNTAPLMIGIKPNLSKMFYKLFKNKENN